MWSTFYCPTCTFTLIFTFHPCWIIIFWSLKRGDCSISQLKNWLCQKAKRPISHVLWDFSPVVWPFSDSPPIDLYFWKIDLEKSSLTNWIFSLFRTWFLLLAVNPVPQTRFFQLDFSKFKCRSTGVRKYIRITYPSLLKNVGVWTRSHIKKKCFLPFQHFHTILRRKCRFQDLIF